MLSLAQLSPSLFFSFFVVDIVVVVIEVFLLFTFIKIRIYQKQAGAELCQAVGWVDEMQNKAEAQPAWLQLAAGAAAGA